MRIGGNTKPFAVLGHPIDHSLSPLMHNASFNSLGLDAVYLAFDIKPSLLMNVLTAMREMGFIGANLTIPLKEIAFEELNLLDRSATELRAVNTIRFREDGELKGYNTDGVGFVNAFEESFGKKLAGLSVFILGCGGAGRAIAITCATHGAKRVYLSDIELDRSVQTAKEIAQIVPSVEVEMVEALDSTQKEVCRSSQLVVQSTPLGMKRDDPSVLSEDAFYQGQMVFDIIYMYPETATMKVAKGAGAKVTNGLSMLLYQGAKAFQIWTGKEADIEAMRSALQAEVYR